MADDLSTLITEETERLFWAKVEKRGPDECWYWLAAVNSCGYGNIGVGRKTRAAPHVALALAGCIRPDAPNHCALHSCDHPSCVNPAHLRWGSQKENAIEREARGRGGRKGPTGETAPHAQLTKEQVKMILASPKMGKDLALEFGVHKATISDIRCGKTWRHLLVPIT